MDQNPQRENSFARRVETTANICIIVVAVIGATLLAKNFRFSPPQTDVPAVADSTKQKQNKVTGPAAGSTLSVPGIDWAESGETVVLALSNKCHFCSESAPFYKRLVRELSQRKDVRIVAVFPQEISEAKEYLSKLEVPIYEVKQARLDSFGIKGTPTLVIVDHTGVVKYAWVGRLTTDKESEVLGLVKI